MNGRDGLAMEAVDQNLWTVDEVAHFLGVAPKTVRKWQLNGTLPFVKLGGKLVRFQPQEIRNWVSGRAVGPRPSTESVLIVDLRRRLAQ